MSKNFPTQIILSVVTGFLPSREPSKKISSQIDALLKYMTQSKSLGNYQRRRAFDNCATYLMDRYPQLAEAFPVKGRDIDSLEELPEFFKKQVQRIGDSMLVDPIPDYLQMSEKETQSWIDGY